MLRSASPSGRNGSCVRTADHTEALKAYAEKRPPQWEGR